MDQGLVLSSPLSLASCPCLPSQAFWSVSPFPWQIWPPGWRQGFTTTTKWPGETELLSTRVTALDPLAPFQAGLAEPGSSWVEGGLGEPGPALSASQVGIMGLGWVGADCFSWGSPS